jgi:hypothetical protein
VIASGAGSPWTVAYGPEGAEAISGGSAPVTAQVSGSARPGGTLACGPGYARAEPHWQPRGIGTYAWTIRESHEVLAQRERAEQGLLPPEPAGESLDELLGRDHGPELLVPGSALGRELACHLWLATPSNVVTLPGVLQISSDFSRSGESLVDLKLSRAAGRHGTLRVAPLEKECAGERPAIASAHLAPGGDLRLRLTSPGGGPPGYFRATATVGGRTYSVELIVPAQRSVRPRPG